MLAAIKQPEICHVCGQHEFEIHSPGHTLTTIWRRSKRIAAIANYAKTILQQPQTSCSCMLPLSTNPTEPTPRQMCILRFRGGGVVSFRVFEGFSVKVFETFGPQNYGKHFRIRNYLAVSIYLPLRRKEKPVSSYS